MATEEAEKKTRIKRPFVKIIMDKVNEHTKNFSSPQLVEIRKKLEDDLATLEKVLAESKKSSKKTKARFNKLKAFSREEIQTYLDSLQK